ncbi:MAG: FeoA family protein [Chloroflexota bacterium]|nr:FeoA family protein [Chloroflexota bacterium]
MVLADAKCGQSVRIVSYTGGQGVVSKLRQLSLMPGDCVQVVKKAPLHGPVLIESQGRSVALGRGIAARVQVEVV